MLFCTFLCHQCTATYFSFFLSSKLTLGPQEFYTKTILRKCCWFHIPTVCFIGQKCVKFVTLQEWMQIVFFFWKNVWMYNGNDIIKFICSIYPGPFQRPKARNLCRCVWVVYNNKTAGSGRGHSHSFFLKIPLAPLFLHCFPKSRF